MKLWIDDIRGAPDSSWTVARTVSEAIRYLARFEMTEISIDHDISHYTNLDESDVEQQVYACHETFGAVAYYMALKYRHREHPKITIHSSNPVGAKEIHSILADSLIPSEVKPYPPSLRRLEVGDNSLL